MFLETFVLEPGRRLADVVRAHSSSPGGTTEGWKVAATHLVQTAMRLLEQHAPKWLVPSRALASCRQRRAMHCVSPIWYHLAARILTPVRGLYLAAPRPSRCVRVGTGRAHRRGNGRGPFERGGAMSLNATPFHARAAAANSSMPGRTAVVHAGGRLRQRREGQLPPVRCRSGGCLVALAWSFQVTKRRRSSRAFAPAMPPRSVSVPRWRCCGSMMPGAVRGQGTVIRIAANRFLLASAARCRVDRKCRPALRRRRHRSHGVRRRSSP